MDYVSEEDGNQAGDLLSKDAAAALLPRLLGQDTLCLLCLLCLLTFESDIIEIHLFRR